MRKPCNLFISNTLFSHHFFIFTHQFIKMILGSHHFEILMRILMRRKRFIFSYLQTFSSIHQFIKVKSEKKYFTNIYASFLFRLQVIFSFPTVRNYPFDLGKGEE